MTIMKTMAPLFLAAGILLMAQQTPAEQQGEAVNLSKGQDVYVPVYSHVHLDPRRRVQLTIILSIRNTDRSQAIDVHIVDYFDSDGKLVRSYLDAPRKIRPLGTAEFYVERLDTTGGSGANFIVGWRAKAEVVAPVVEAWMISTGGAQAFSLLGKGRVIWEAK